MVIVQSRQSLEEALVIVFQSSDNWDPGVSKIQAKREPAAWRMREI